MKMASIFTYVTGSYGEPLVVFAVVFLMTYLLYRRHSVSHSRHKFPPSFPSLPVIGSLPFLPTKQEDLAQFCLSPRNQLGKIFSFRLGSKYFVVISGKKAIHEALLIKSLDFADRPEFYYNAELNKDAKGILTSHYDSKFKAHHRLCLSILKRFGFGQRVMETRILMEVEEMISRLREEQGRSFDMRELTTSCVANVMMNMLFGHRFDHSDPGFQQLITDMHDGVADFSLPLEIFPVLRFLPYFKKLIAKARRLDRRIINFINSHIAACTENEAKTERFVNYFIEAHGPDYDAELLMFTLADLIVAGMETTTTFIRWAVVILTNHVSVQERLRAEIDSVIDRQRLPTLDDRSRLPYVEATILELLRYKTLVPLALPHRTLNDTEVGGYFIPGETTVMVNLHSVHMDPDDWQQPQQFRPERFLNESGNVINRDRIIAFSLGKRSCLGEQLARQEMFLFLVSLLQNFYFKPPEGQDSIVVHEKWGGTMTPSDYEVRMVVREP